MWICYTCNHRVFVGTRKVHWGAWYFSNQSAQYDALYLESYESGEEIQEKLNQEVLEPNGRGSAQELPQGLGRQLWDCWLPRKHLIKNAQPTRLLLQAMCLRPPRSRPKREILRSRTGEIRTVVQRRAIFLYALPPWKKEPQEGSFYRGANQIRSFKTYHNRHRCCRALQCDHTFW